MFDDGIPEFLRRPSMTDEDKKRLKRITREAARPYIKNPPKRITRKMRERLVGGVFGRVVKT